MGIKAPSAAIREAVRVGLDKARNQDGYLLMVTSDEYGDMPTDLFRPDLQMIEGGTPSEGALFTTGDFRANVIVQLMDWLEERRILAGRGEYDRREYAWTLADIILAALDHYENKATNE